VIDLDLPLTGAAAPRSEAELDEYLSRPTAGTVNDLAAMSGDILVLGAGGKMGYTLCRMARRSFDVAGLRDRQVVGVSRFADPGSRDRFGEAGIETIAADLLETGALESLPDAPNVVYLAGTKFGSTGNLPATWAMNTLLPGLVARHFSRARIVALSTGNVYPLVPIASGGATETDTPGPVGEYAQSCLGRERMFGYYSDRLGLPVAIIRLNYANALRYGVLLDVALKVAASEPIDVSMGHVNVIWQGEASVAILRALAVSAAPPVVVNVSGPETASVRWIASRFAELLDVTRPSIVGAESETALLSNSSRCHALFGYPAVPLDQLLQWTAAWIQGGGRLLNKPTSFQVRDGQF